VARVLRPLSNIVDAFRPAGGKRGNKAPIVVSLTETAKLTASV